MTREMVIAAHEASGRYFSAAGVRSFVRQEGEGDPVVCLHGVPASSFLYRKVIAELARRGLSGVAFDFPGLGLADRPVDFDYSWTGLGRFAREAIQALDLPSFHLVVHDIGGPVGFEVAVEMPERIKSLTLLNTVIDVDGFRPPIVMRPFAHPQLGSWWLRSMVGPVFRQLMFLQGIHDRSVITTAELDAWLALLKRNDDGQAFLRIMRGFEGTASKQTRYRSAVQDVPYPVQIVWGEHDPALTLGRFGRTAQALIGADTIHTVPGKHFLQEDNAPAIADHVARIAGQRT